VSIHPQQKIQLGFDALGGEVHFDNRLHRLIGVGAQAGIVDQFHQRAEAATHHAAEHAAPQCGGWRCAVVVAHAAPYGVW
jgi:hypothetical protein